MSAKGTVYVVDDDPSVRRSLARLARAAGYEAQAFASAGEFLASEDLRATGCLVLDVRMPGLSGMDLQEEMRKTGRAMPIVFLTGHGDVPTSVEAMKKGAVDFLTKPVNDEELLAAIAAAIRKAAQDQAARTEAQEVRRRYESLSPREQEVLRYVLTGMLNKQIALALHIAEKTVKVHRGRVMEKMRAESVAELVRMTQKAGIEPAAVGRQTGNVVTW
jgi:FixJ family two-component response regulator